MRVLIISESGDSSATLCDTLQKGLPEARIIRYESKLGKPLRTFDWSVCDVVLMANEEALPWLRDLIFLTDFPPVVLLAGGADAVEASKLGAYAVLDSNTNYLSALCDSLRSAIEPSTLQEDEPDNDFSWTRFAANYSAQSQSEGYKFVRLIGQGAMSKVYLAERLDSGQTVVLKVLDRAMVRREENVRRFVREAALISDIKSPYVVKVYEHGFTNAYGYICMEFFSRGDLAQRLSNRISKRHALLYALNIAYGLDAIHRVGIIHRDLKPANMMFRADDSLALADFGICKPLDASMDLTVDGSIVGTPYYMSPEQVRSDDIDERADIYSLGVMLYEMLTGTKPFPGSSMGAVMHQHINADIPRLTRELRAYQPLVDTLMAKDPEQRPATASRAAELLRDQTMAA